MIILRSIIQGLTLGMAVATVAIGGCAATVVKPAVSESNSSVSAAKINIPPSATKKLVLQVNASPAVKADSDWAAFMEEWDTSMRAVTVESNIAFAYAEGSSSTGGEPATLVNINVNSFRYVSQVKRYMIGVFAGNASMDVDVEYVELPGMKSLGTQKLNTSSSFMQGVFSAMTPKQVNAVTTEIVGVLKSASAR